MEELSKAIGAFLKEREEYLIFSEEEEKKKIKEAEAQDLENEKKEKEKKEMKEKKEKEGQKVVDNVILPAWTEATSMAKSIMKAADINGNGELSFTELTINLQNTPHEDYRYWVEQQKSEGFRGMDKDHGGTIGQEEP